MHVAPQVPPPGQQPATRDGLQPTQRTIREYIEGGAVCIVLGYRAVE